MGEPDGLLSLGSHRVRHDQSDLAAAAESNKAMCLGKTCTIRVIIWYARVRLALFRVCVELSTETKTDWEMLSHCNCSIHVCNVCCCCSVAKSWLTLRPHNSRTPGFPVLHYLPEFVQTDVCWVSDATQPSHPLSSPSPLALNVSQHQGLFLWIDSSHQVAKGLALQLQHQSFAWIFRVDFL